MMLMQGLANLLWSYAKMTVPPVDVMMVIVCRMTEMLQDPHMSHNFDAQVCIQIVMGHCKTSSY